MNLGELRTEVTTHLREYLGNLKYWSLADIDKAINAGYMNMSDHSEWYEVILPIPYQARRGYYDLRGLSVPVLSVRQLYNMGTQRPILPWSIRDADATYRQWEHIGGDPERYFVRGLHLLNLWPRPSRDSGQARAAVTSLPPPLVYESDIPGFDSDYHWGLVEYALYELKSDDRESKTALGHFSAYLKYRNDLAERVQTRQSLDKLHSYGRP